MRARKPILAGQGAACGGLLPLFSRREIAAALPTLAENPDAVGSPCRYRFPAQKPQPPSPRLQNPPNASGIG
ncbi:hypothetical protein D7X33_10825 [Butyricicoccus sp. 1XD8-22]|nr:hypothetical protein D7X33_10825 [Butyricicoccus sp. 1XD8-22]